MSKQQKKKKDTFPLEASIMMEKIDNKQIPWTNKYIMYQLLVSTLECSNNIIVTGTFLFGIILGQMDMWGGKGHGREYTTPN